MIDLYSDTHTRPTAAMREAMAAAEVGDEQMMQDPTVNALCERVADLLGKEAAVFMPSGTMCNQIAFRVWCRPGEEVILEQTTHPIHAETGGPAANAGVMLRTIAGERGLFRGEQVRAALRHGTRHEPRQRLLAVENTTNFGGGAVWPLPAILGVTAVARDAGLACHLDGARLMNAAVAGGRTAAEICAPFDSAWLDFSKGLGAPVGAALAGSRAFIDEAWRYKQMMGGAMRQAGIIAAGCLYALDHHIERLAEDHVNAKRLAEGLMALEGVEVDAADVETNIVWFDVSGGREAGAVARALAAEGVLVGAFGRSRMRAVTHLDVDAAAVDGALIALARVLQDA